MPLQTIIKQGEGTASSPEAVVGGGFAHYYRYMQIQKQRRLVTLPAPGKYAYDGDPVPLDVGGVYPVPTNPKSASYPAGSVQRFLCDNFNYTYTALLNALNIFLNGENNASQYATIVGLMMSLKEQAIGMMAGYGEPPVIYVGPSFEYQPVNPAA